MALTDQQKQAIDAMSIVDKVLAILYIFGVDNPNLAVGIGEAAVYDRWPHLRDTNLTNEQLAIAFLLWAREEAKRIYIHYRGDQTAGTFREQVEQAQENAGQEVAYGDIGNIPGV